MTELAACEPTTLQGAAELTNYLLEIVDKEGIEVPTEIDTRAILTNVMIAVATLGDATVPVVVGRSI